MGDSAYCEVIGEIVSKGHEINPSRGKAFQLIAHKFTLEDCRNRLIHNEVRSWNLAQSLGQYLWIMAGRNDLDFVKYYNSHATEFSSDGIKLIGSYGPRINGVGNKDQTNFVIDLLKKKENTRRAIISVYSPELDHHELSDEIPCIMNMQFVPVDGRLHAITHMRSQEALFMLPHDLFFFTMLHEYIASCAGLECGTYTHFSGSIHIYEEHLEFAKKVVQNPSSSQKMPSMSLSNSKMWLNALLSIEEEIRTEAKFRNRIQADSIFKKISKFEEYWKDLAFILLAYGLRNTNQTEELETINDSISKAFLPFISADRLLTQKQTKYNSLVSDSV